VVAGDAGWRTPWLALTGALSLIAGGVAIVVVEKAYSAPMPVVVVALMLAVAPTQLMAAWPSPAGLARTVEIAVAILGVAAGLVVVHDAGLSIGELREASRGEVGPVAGRGGAAKKSPPPEAAG